MEKSTLRMWTGRCPAHRLRNPVDFPTTPHHQRRIFNRESKKQKNKNLIKQPFVKPLTRKCTDWPDNTQLIFGVDENEDIDEYHHITMGGSI